MTDLTQSDINRFWAKVDKRPDGCWIWTGAIDTPGYGAFKVKGKKYNSHRVSLSLKMDLPLNFKGDTCHTCDNRLCVSWDHLWLGSRSENMVDCRDKGRLTVFRGADHSWSRLTHKQAIMIKFFGGCTSAEWARLLNVGETTIQDVRKCRTWAHITSDMANALMDSMQIGS